MIGLVIYPLLGLTFFVVFWLAGGDHGWPARLERWRRRYR